MTQAAITIAVLILGPIFFVGLWCGISGLLAVLSGYRGLAERFSEPRGFAGTGRPLPTPFYTRIGITSYRGYLITLDANQAGLGIQVSRLFPFHPPLRIPWGKVVMGAPSRFRLFATRSFVLDGTTTIHVSEDAAEGVATAQRDFTGG